jgi:hypothetical protein
MQTSHVADVGDWLVAILRRPRHAPARHHEFALAVGAHADDGRHLVRENTGQDQQVARAVMPRAKPVANRGLASCEAVEIVHQRFAA